MSMQPEVTSRPHQPSSTLGEIYRRLVHIHYPLAESPTVDADLHRRTLERLNELLAFVEDAEARDLAAAAPSGDHRGE